MARPQGQWQRDHNVITTPFSAAPSGSSIDQFDVATSMVTFVIFNWFVNFSILMHLWSERKETQLDTAEKTTAGFLSAFAVQNGDLPSISQALCSWNLEGHSQHSFPCSLRSLTLVLLKAASCNVLAVGRGISWDDSLMADELCHLLQRRLSS